MFFDVKFNNSKGYYDISLDNNGNISTTNGLDTAILLTLFTDARADDSEVQEAINRRGWWGNAFSPFVDSNVGSKIWLLANDTPTSDTKALATSYARQACQFLIDGGYVDNLNVVTTLTTRSLRITITTIIGSDITDYNLTLWGETNVTVQ